MRDSTRIFPCSPVAGEEKDDFSISVSGYDWQELQKAKAEKERGGSSPYMKCIDSPRLHHLRGSDSPHSRLGFIIFF